MYLILQCISKYSLLPVLLTCRSFHRLYCARRKSPFGLVTRRKEMRISQRLLIWTIGIGGFDKHLKREECIQLLRQYSDVSVVRWCLSKFPDLEYDIFSIICRQNSMECMDYMVAYWRYFSKLTPRAIYQSSLCGNLQMMESLLSDGCPFDSSVAEAAALGGHLHILQWLQCHLPSTIARNDKIYEKAAIGGNLRILEWVRMSFPQCPWTAAVPALAARHNHLHVLEWLLFEGCPYDESVVIAAAAGGHIRVLRWLSTYISKTYKSNRGVFSHSRRMWTHKACNAAALHGQLPVLKWLRAMNPPCEWTVITCANAAASGNLNMLRFMRRQVPPCPWDEMTIAVAKDDRIIQWLHRHNAPEAPSLHVDDDGRESFPCIW